MNRNTKILTIVIVVVAVCAIAFFGIRNQMKQHSGDDKNVIKIGAILPLTGDMSEEGQKGLAAIKLAIEKQNKQNQNKKYKLLVEDGKFTGKDSLLAYKKMMNEAPKGIISYGTPPTQAIMNDAVKDGVPLLALDGTAGLSASGKNIFECWTPFHDVGEAAGKLASKLSSKGKKALLAMNVSGGIDFEKGFLQTAENCVLIEKYDQNATDARGLIAKVLAANPEVICVFGFNTGHTTVLRQLLESDYSGILVTDSNITHKIDILPQSEKIKIYFVSQAFGDYNPKTKEFISEVEKDYGITPTVFSAHLYEMARILMACTPDNSVSYEEIAESISKEKDFDSILGNLSFVPPGDIHLPFINLSVENKQIKVFQ